MLDLGFAFAIEDVDPTIGTVFAYHIEWFPYGGVNDRIETPIELVDCKEL